MRKAIRYFFFAISVLSVQGCMFYFPSGVKPLEPTPKKFRSAKVDSVTPTLRWEPHTDKKYEESNPSYDLQIIKCCFTMWNDVNMVYERRGITTNHHKIEKPLEYDTRYYWRVRAIYIKNNKEIIRKWNGWIFVTIAPGGGHDKYHYKFRTPKP